MKSSLPTIGPRKSASGKDVPCADPKKKRRRNLAVGLLLLLLLGAWYLWPSSQMARARQMQEELFSTPPDQLSPEERKEKLAALRAEQETLSPEERKELRNEMRKVFQKKMNAEAAKYLAMSPDERRKVIDQRLAREQARPQKGPQGGPTSGQAGGAGGPGPGQGPGGPRGGGTPEQRDVMRRDFLLGATPAARAGMDQMRMDMAVRRTELGLPPSVRGFGGR